MTEKVDLPDNFKITSHTQYIEYMLKFKHYIDLGLLKEITPKGYRTLETVLKENPNLNDYSSSIDEFEFDCVGTDYNYALWVSERSGGICKYPKGLYPKGLPVEEIR